MKPRTVTDMISWMMPAMRSSTAACAAGGTVGSRSVRGGVGRRGVLLRTAQNFPPPSWGVFGAQHIRMLEPMHARIPQTAPIAPAQLAPKPMIEKMELPQVCAVHDKNERANAAHAHCVR